jgi:tellurite resistance protein TehA-like permease
MATGIVSNAFYYLSHDRISDVLFGITLLAFPVLLDCLVVRMLAWPRAVWRDLATPGSCSRSSRWWRRSTCSGCSSTSAAMITSRSCSGSERARAPHPEPV